MSGVTVVTPASANPIEDNEIKRALRIATNDSTHDNLISTARSTATQIVEEYLGRSLINRTLKLSLDALPYEDDNIPIQEGVSVGPYMSYISRSIYLPQPPLVSVTHIKTFNDSDTATTLSTGVYYVDTAKMHYLFNTGKKPAYWLVVNIDVNEQTINEVCRYMMQR